ncbi:hypothetical protein G4F99_06535 [Hafnia paralvei]|uniref:hypothetical protein n=1 Tax=Hafnia paralvei TaxID=546367 RepID=UPI00158483EE|nr:hypothetical protein [Hafnia paralvei]NUN41268.1 hypothetical protein [Hafnia paralvei]
MNKSYELNIDPVNSLYRTNSLSKCAVYIANSAIGTMADTENKSIDSHLLVLLEVISERVELLRDQLEAGEINVRAKS